VIKWPVKLYVLFTFFFQNPKKHDFLRFLSFRPMDTVQIVHGAKCLVRGKTIMRRIAYGGEISMRGANCPWGAKSINTSQLLTHSFTAYYHAQRTTPDVIRSTVVHQVNCAAYTEADEVSSSQERGQVAEHVERCTETATVVVK